MNITEDQDSLSLRLSNDKRQFMEDEETTTPFIASSADYGKPDINFMSSDYFLYMLAMAFLVCFDMFTGVKYLVQNNFVGHDPLHHLFKFCFQIVCAMPTGRI